MSLYKERFDGRTFEDLRPMDAKVGVIKNAQGSAMFKLGKTVAIAAVYGPRDLYPKFLQDPKQALLRCHYNMMPFSGSGGDRIRPGGNRRSKEISEVITESLKRVINLKRFPGAGVDVFIEILQADAGTRCAGICAASMALADAGFEMLDLIPAVSVGKVDKTLLVDLDYAEEAFEAEVADIPIAIIPSTGEFTLLQMDGIVTKEQLIGSLKLAQPACEKILAVMRQALRDKYEEDLQ